MAAVVAMMMSFTVLDSNINWLMLISPDCGRKYKD